MLEQNNVPAVNADDDEDDEDDDDDNDGILHGSLARGQWRLVLGNCRRRSRCLAHSEWANRQLSIYLSPCPPLRLRLRLRLSLLAAIDPFRIQIAIAGHANFNYTTDHLGRHGDEVTASP